MIELTSNIRLLQRFADELAPWPRRPRLADHPRADRDAARYAWATRIADEYRSVAVFSELLQLLADLEAPFPALCAVQRLIGDELRHTQVTAQVVDWLGGGLRVDLRDVGLPPRDEPAAIRALRIIQRELVVTEQESIYVLAAYRDAATEPAIRAVLAGILTDEVRHAAAGRALYALFDRGHLADLVAPARTELAALEATDRAQLRDDYLRSATGGPGRALGASLEPADLERIWVKACGSRANRPRAPARARRRAGA